MKNIHKLLNLLFSHSVVVIRKIFRPTNLFAIFCGVLVGWAIRYYMIKKKIKKKI